MRSRLGWVLVKLRESTAVAPRFSSLGPAADGAAIERLGRQLGVRIPDSVRDVYLRVGDGDIFDHQRLDHEEVGGLLVLPDRRAGLDDRRGHGDLPVAGRPSSAFSSPSPRTNPATCWRTTAAPMTRTCTTSSAMRRSRTCDPCTSRSSSSGMPSSTIRNSSPRPSPPEVFARGAERLRRGPASTGPAALEC